MESVCYDRCDLHLIRLYEGEEKFAEEKNRNSGAIISFWAYYEWLWEPATGKYKSGI